MSALPLLSDPRGASAASAFPKRLIICFSPNGTIPAAWLPTGSGASFTLGEIMLPLEAHKKDLIIVDNLTMSAALNSPGGDAHGLGVGCLLTGTEVLAGINLRRAWEVRAAVGRAAFRWTSCCRNDR